MPLVEHLRELRNRLMKAVVAILVITIVAALFYRDIIDFLVEPVQAEVGCAGGMGSSEDGKPCVMFTLEGLVSPVTVALKVSLMAGMVLAAPVWLYQLWAFLAPGLHRHERKYALWFVGMGAPLFFTGAVLAYRILPQTAAFLIEFTPDDTQNLFRIDDYINIVTRMVVVFGAAFELPLVLLMLNVTGVITGKQLAGWWRVMVIGIAVFAAVATPGGEPLAMLSLTAPIVLLYFGAVGFSLLNDRRRERNNPYKDLDDDEASELDHNPEPVPGAGALREREDAPEGESRRREGYGDAT